MVVEIWTDGACAGNPGPGGYAALLCSEGYPDLEITGGEAETTNNRMELRSVIEGLKAIKRSTTVRIYLDSSYVMNAFSKNWLQSWQQNGWKTANKQPVKNRDLWEQLQTEVARHQVSWIKVKGHSGVKNNERVDLLAVAERDRHATTVSTSE